MKSTFCLLVFLLSVSSAFADHLQVINHAVASLEQRLEMIERAQDSIDVEYFIYKNCESGRLFTQALIKKKQEKPSIQIRILIDASITLPNLNKNEMAAMIDAGLEVRLYNTVSTFLHFKRAQYRDHRKLLLIDGKEALTGSRNIGDEYFDLSPEFNFKDRDIWIQGPVVTQMAQSFEDYWANDRVVAPKKGKIDAEAADFLTENDHDRFMRTEIARVGKPILADPKSQGDCDQLSYYTDDPGYQSTETRKVLPKVIGRIDEMKEGETLYIESPYFVIHDKDAKEEMYSMKDRNVSWVLLTNSVNSTDAFYIAANFYPKTSFYERVSESKMYVFEGVTPNNTPFVQDEKGDIITKDAVWGIHAKSFVFSDTAFAVGTFNMDPRSANLNSEELLFCEDNADLSKFVRDDIQAGIDQSNLLVAGRKLDNGKTLLDGVKLKKKIMFWLAELPAELVVSLL